MGAKTGPVAKHPGDAVFAAMVGRVRAARGWSVREFSERLGKAGLPLVPSGVWKLEQGDRRVSVGEAQVVANVLDVPLDALTLGKPVTLKIVVVGEADAAG